MGTRLAGTGWVTQPAAEATPTRAVQATRFRIKVGAARKGQQPDAKAAAGAGLTAITMLVCCSTLTLALDVWHVALRKTGSTIRSIKYMCKM